MALINPKIGDKVVHVHDSTYTGIITRLKYVPAKGLSQKEYWFIYLDNKTVPCGYDSTQWNKIETTLTN